MNTLQAVEELSFLKSNQKFPYEAMETFIQNQEEVTLTLLNALDYVYEQKMDLDGEYMLHQYAIHLLGQFREKKAFPKLLKLLELDPDSIDFVVGDTLTESYGEVLCSTFNGDLDLLKSVIENKSLNYFARNEALGAYGRLFLKGTVSRKSYVSYLGKFFNQKDEFVQSAIECACDFKLHELIPEIKQAYMNGEADDTMSQYRDIISGIFSEKTDVKIYMEDAIKAMEWWACFEDRKTGKLQLEQFEQLQRELTQKSVKVGRNDLCPCGSGKKYKKCCLNSKPKQDAFELEALKYYPSLDKSEIEGQISFSDYFKDEEALEIDRLVQLGKFRPYHFGFGRDISSLESKKLDYLWNAYELLISKMERERITSFIDYDQKYAVTYFIFEWLENLYQLLKDSNLSDKSSRISLFMETANRYNLG